MAYFSVTGLKVLIFLLGATQGIHRSSAKEPDLSMVANILQTLFKTYTYSLRESNNFVIDTDKPPQLETTIEKLVNRKVKELKPFLQDYDNSENVMRENIFVSDEKNKDLSKALNNEDDNITLEGEEDTTIIEFYPDTDTQKPTIRINNYKPSEFKDNIRKYKIIRDNIKRALIEESVSFQTKKLITHTLDDMLAFLVRSQCPANSNLDDTFNNSLRSKTVARTTKDLAKDWTEQWHAIKDKYNRISKDHFPHQPNPARKLFLFFEQIQEFLTNMVNDSEHISNNYKVVCKLVKKHNTVDEVYFNNLNLVNFRTDRQDRKTFNCPMFKICSDELRQFIGRFYNNLNETAVSTFTNYAAMYMSDINSDGSGEKESVITVINKLGNITEQKISKIFKKATEKFEIDHDKDKDENIRLLRSFVSDTIETCLYTMKSNVNSEIVSLRAKLIDNLKQDLKSNIDIDLENLAAELKDRICTDFSSCNRHIMRRSFNSYNNEIKSRAHKPIDKNKVYVKLQMNFDKKLKEDIARGNVDFLDAFVPINNIAREQSFTITQIVNVTRTTQHDKAMQSKIYERTTKKENFERSPKKVKFEKTLIKNKSQKILKKDKIKRNLKKEKLLNNLVTEEAEKKIKMKILENSLEIEESKSNKKKDQFVKTLKREKSKKNSESEEFGTYLKEDKLENDSETKEFEKNSDIDVTERTAKSMRTTRKIKGDKFENDSETEESEKNSDIDVTERTAKSMRNTRKIKGDKFKKDDLETEESAKNSDIDVTKRTANPERTTREMRSLTPTREMTSLTPTREMRSLTPTREMRSTREIKEMKSTRLISHEVSAEILGYELF